MGNGANTAMAEFGQPCVLVFIFVCSFGSFQFWFRGQDLGSDCLSSWTLLTFFVSTSKFEDSINKRKCLIECQYHFLICNQVAQRATIAHLRAK